MIIEKNRSTLLAPGQPCPAPIRRSLARPAGQADCASARGITGVFRIGDIDSVLLSLRELYGLRARREGQDLILERDG